MAQQTISASANAKLRKRSKKLFGNADRLEVAHAVAQGSGVFYAQELADELGISPPRVRAQLLAFCEAGAIRTMPRVELKQLYERIDHDPFWAAVRIFLDKEA
jgi:hypothetical protein